MICLYSVSGVACFESLDIVTDDCDFFELYSMESPQSKI